MAMVCHWRSRIGVDWVALRMGEDRPKPTWMLALLRLGTLGILGFLLLSPMLRSSTETRESPVLPVLVDATSSQWLGADSAARKTALDGLVADLPRWGDGVEWDVDLFSFDRELRALNGVDGQTWQPNGKRTDLGHAFESLRDRYVHRNVPAVLVVTDGRSNRGPDPEFTAERLEVPHLFVGTGDTSLVTDVEVSKLRTNEVAYLGNAFPVEITAKARGAANVPLTLRLYSEARCSSPQLGHPITNSAAPHGRFKSMPMRLATSLCNRPSKPLKVGKDARSPKSTTGNKPPSRSLKAGDASSLWHMHRTPTSPRSGWRQRPTCTRKPRSFG